MLNSPYPTTLFLDNDAFPCSNFLQLLGLLDKQLGYVKRMYEERYTVIYWQLPALLTHMHRGPCTVVCAEVDDRRVDVIDAVAPYPYGGSYNRRLVNWEPAQGVDRTGKPLYWSSFPERNTGIRVKDYSMFKYLFFNSAIHAAGVILYNSTSPAVRYLLEQYHEVPPVQAECTRPILIANSVCHAAMSVQRVL